MLSLSPLAIAFVVIVAVSAVGVIITLVSKANRFAGYEGLAQAAPRIAAKLKHSDIFRDGGDLVVSGNRKGVPLLIRFSNSESTPGLNITGGAPIGFTATFSPKERSTSAAGQLVRTGNAKLDARFTVRTTAPQEANLFISSTLTQEHLEKLCCSRDTLLQLSRGKIELSELLIPRDADEHVLEHLNSFAVLSQQAAKMPAAHSVKVEQMKGEGSSWVLKAAIAIGIIAIVIVLLSYRHPPGEVEATSSVVSNGIAPVDARVIPNVLAWKTADPKQLRPDLIAWFHGFGIEPATKMDLDASGTGAPSTAYFLVTDKNPDAQRAVWVRSQQILCDIVGHIDGVVGIPRDSIARIRQGQDAPGPRSDGEGLLLVRDYNDPASATVFFMSQGRMNSISPQDFHTLQLR